jgi:hypothetical protein
MVRQVGVRQFAFPMASNRLVGNLSVVWQKGLWRASPSLLAPNFDNAMPEDCVCRVLLAGALPVILSITCCGMRELRLSPVLLARVGKR